jgi:hypothetical protein
LYISLHQYFSDPDFKVKKIVIDKVTYKLIRCLAFPYFYPVTERTSFRRGKVGYYCKVPIYVDKEINEGFLLIYFNRNKSFNEETVDLLRPLESDKILMKYNYLISDFIEEVNEKIGNVTVERSLNHPHTYLVYTKDMSIFLGNFIYKEEDILLQTFYQGRVIKNKIYSDAKDYLKAYKMCNSHRVIMNAAINFTDQKSFESFTCIDCKTQHSIEHINLMKGKRLKIFKEYEKVKEEGKKFNIEKND